MKASRFSDAHKTFILKQGAHGVPVTDICRKAGISQASFFSSLKRERIRRRTYKTREEARQDVFDYVEMFYNLVRKQVRNGMLSPVEFERQQTLKAEGV
ncbi:putative transposase [Sphingobium sp. OAS761]|nr:putative transposase [Sphingobium sp. OAS761]